MSISFEGEEISQNPLKKIWNQHFASKPFPTKTRAFRLPLKEFQKMHTQLYDRESKDLSIKEYGEIVLWEDCYGFVTRVLLEQIEEEFFFIFTRDSPCPLDDVLRHELEHIFNDDVPTTFKTF
jgi:hypothetical protein